MQINSAINNTELVSKNTTQPKSKVSENGISTNWLDTMESMMETYIDAEITKKQEDCREIFQALSQYKPRVAMEGMEALDAANTAKTNESIPLAEEAENITSELTTGILEGENNEAKTKEYGQLIREKMEELFQKIKNGDTAPSYQIGAQSFTEEEWEDFLEGFDSLEEAMKELARRKRELQNAAKAEREEKTGISEPDIF